jgi:hypothetical protein
MEDLSKYAIPKETLLRSMLEYELEKNIRFGEEHIDEQLLAKIQTIVIRVMKDLGMYDLLIQIKPKADNRTLDITITEVFPF